MTTWLVLAALAAIAASGLPALVLPRGSHRGMRWSTGLSLAGCLVGLVAAAMVLAGGDGAPVVSEWSLPVGRFAVAVDAVSAAFLMLIFTVAGASIVYGERYWSAADHPDSSAKLRLFFGACVGSLALLVIATDGILFLVAWELMALSCFFLV